MTEIKKKQNIVLSNSLVASKYHLTKEEQNLVYLTVSQINKNDEDFKNFKITLSDLEKATGVQHNKKRLKLLQLSIMKKPILLPCGACVNWFSSIKPIENETAIRVRFDSDLKPYLLQLKSEFTKSELGTLFNFKSKYSSRLFLLLKSDFDRQKKYKNNLNVTYTVIDLISRFTMPISYQQRYSLFKNDFINKSINEINEKTELKIVFKELKTGRKITSIEFCISEKEKTHEKVIKEIENTVTASDYIPKNLSPRAISILVDDELGLKKNDLKHIFDHYKISDIESVCEDLWRCWDSPKIMSKQGLLRGKIKQLDKKKTENFSFFDEIGCI